MSVVAFGDESGTHRRGSPCYSIGCFVVPDERVTEIEDALRAIVTSYGIDHELKWTRVGGYRALNDAAFRGVEHLLAAGIAFNVIVVQKGTYTKWRTDTEDAFYVTYYQLAKDIARRAGGPVALRIDQRQDRYAKRTEALEIVTNRALAKIEDSGFVSSISMIDSKQSLILQCTDVLIGAITSDTNCYLDEKAPMNDGKRAFVARVGQLVGWPRLCFDTYPNGAFNVWHFPPAGFRANPETRPVHLRAKSTPARR